MLKKYSIEFKWGTLFAIMSLAWMFVEKSVGLHDVLIHKHALYTNFVAIPSVIIYVFALLDKRKNFFGGQITYMQSFLSGVLISVVVAVLSPLTQTICFQGITPTYFEHAIAYAISSKQMSEEVAREFFNLENYVIQGLFGAIVMGTLTSAIVSIFIRNKK